MASGILTRESPYLEQGCLSEDTSAFQNMDVHEIIGISVPHSLPEADCALQGVI